MVLQTDTRVTASSQMRPSTPPWPGPRPLLLACCSLRFERHTVPQHSLSSPWPEQDQPLGLLPFFPLLPKGEAGVAETELPESPEVRGAQGGAGVPGALPQVGPTLPFLSEGGS